MSIINQMLQDLEKRRASGEERGALPSQVRVLPRPEAHSMHWWGAGIAVLATAIGASAWYFNRQSAPATPPAETTQTPAPSLNQSAPVSRLALDLERVPAKPSRSESRQAAAAAEGTIPPGKREAVAPVVVPATVDPGIKQPPALVPNAEVRNPIPVPVVAQPVAPAVAAPAPSRPVLSVADAGKDARPQAEAGNPQIDKRVPALTPQQTAENEYRAASVALNQGRLAEAQQGFQHALQSNPSHVGARQALFGLLVQTKRTGEAEQLLQEGLRINPNQTGFALALSTLQYERGNVAEAIETMQRSAPAAQGSPDYLARLAALLQRQSRHGEAVEYYQAALRLAPGSGVWQMGLGISLQALNRTAEARDAYRRARESNALSPELQAFVDQRLKQLP